MSTTRILAIELTTDLEAYLTRACAAQGLDSRLDDWARAQLVINAAEELDDDPVAKLSEFGV